MNSIKPLLFAALILPRLFGQGDGDFIFALGTTATDSAEREWAWLTLSATRPELLLDRQVAVFRRIGDPGTTDSFELESVIGLQTDPRILELFIQRSVNLGADPAALESDLASLFQGIQLEPSLTRAERLLAVMAGSLGDPGAMDNLMWLARKHPALAMALGLGHASLMQGNKPHVFELREWHADQGAAGAVLGRVSLVPGEVRLLPAPVGLIEVPDEGPGGHLNIQLSWEPGDDLRRLSLLQFGYEVFRIEADFAEGKGLALAAPTHAQLSLWLAEEPGLVRQVNRLPVMINETLPPGEAVFVDDNDRFNPAGTPFADGSRFYYYVAARDLLGRIGLLSAPVEVTVCDRVPPMAPLHVTVLQVRDADEETGLTRERMRITWRQVHEPPGGAALTYQIFRDGGAGPAVLATGIPHILTDPPTPTQSWFDDTLDPNDFNTTYVYTVRVARAGACGELLSPPSGPAFGNLTDWTSPPPLDGFVVIRCPRLEAKYWQLQTEPQADILPHMIRGRVTRPLDNRRVEWAEMRWLPGTVPTTTDPDSATSLGYQFFPEEGKDVWFDIDHPGTSSITLFCRVGQGADLVSGWDVVSITIPQDLNLRTARFTAEQSFVWDEPGIWCNTHTPPEEGDPEAGPGDPPGDNPVITVGPVAAGHEYRLYREVNGGSRTLMASGINVVEALVTISDDIRGGPTCSRICYYVQQVNAHGFAGPLRRLGCFATANRPAPVPDLSEPLAKGDPEAPEVTLHWYTPPYGVRYFEVWVGMETPLPETVGHALGPNRLPPNSRAVFTVDGFPRELYAGVYQTGVVGNGFGTPGEAEFTVSLPVALNREYIFAVKAAGECGNSGFSLAHAFRWTPPDLGPEVPWPARPLPDVTPGIIPRMQAKVLPGAVGIRIGRLPYVAPNEQISQPFTLFGFNGNPMDFLYEDANGRNMFPFLLYRVQVPSVSLPEVTGSAVQVSPLLETIAHQVSGPDIILRDPFFLPQPDEDHPNADFGDLYVLDTQPVLLGARYQYFLLQLDDRYEPLRVIPLNTVEIPE